MFILFYITPTTLSSSITYLGKSSEKNSVTLGELLGGVLWKAVSVTELKNSDLRDINTGLSFFWLYISRFTIFLTMEYKIKTVKKSTNFYNSYFSSQNCKKKVILYHAILLYLAIQTFLSEFWVHISQFWLFSENGEEKSELWDKKSQ